MEKAFLRKEYMEKRMRLNSKKAEDYSLLIADNTLKFLAGKHFQLLHLFLPQLKNKEINTWQIISALWESAPEVRISVPYVIPNTHKMEHYLLTKDTVLIENRWGIPEPEPITEKKILPEMLDTVLIPLLAFDESGYRAGYGGGFYDRFLAQCRPDTLKVGLSYFEPVTAINDLDKFDIKMDVCITPIRKFCWK